MNNDLVDSNETTRGVQAVKIHEFQNKILPGSSHFTMKQVCIPHFKLA